MILLIFVIPILTLIYAGVRIWAISTPTRHQRCLKNIARLERELGIGLDDRVGPGPGTDLRFFDPNLDPKSLLARDMAARGMLYSAEYEAARQLLYPDKQGVVA